MKRISHRYRYGTKEISYRYKDEIDQLDIPDWKKQIAYEATPYTASWFEPIIHLIDATESIIVNNIPGDFVECGVWMGGSCMIMAEVMKHYNQPRTIWMYDTYDGIPVPDAIDNNVDYGSLRDLFFEENRLDEDGKSSWCYTSLYDVQLNMNSIEYPGKIEYVEGLVEDTIPQTIPEQIAMLRVDVDLVKPTKWIFKHMYPRLVSSGCLIVDDYGHFPNLAASVDEYLQQKLTMINVNAGYHIK